MWWIARYKNEGKLEARPAQAERNGIQASTQQGIWLDGLWTLQELSSLMKNSTNIPSERELPFSSVSPYRRGMFDIARGQGKDCACLVDFHKQRRRLPEGGQPMTPEPHTSTPAIFTSSTSAQRERHTLHSLLRPPSSLPWTRTYRRPGHATVDSSDIDFTLALRPPTRPAPSRSAIMLPTVDTSTDSGRSSPLSSVLSSPMSSAPSSPLSSLASSPSPPPEMALPKAARAPPNAPYPSPPASQQTSQSGSPAPDGMDSSNSTDKEGPPPAKRRRISKERSTEYLDMRDGEIDEEQRPELDRVLNVLHKRQKIVVIAGAGISVSAGSKTCSQSFMYLPPLTTKNSP